MAGQTYGGGDGGGFCLRVIELGFVLLLAAALILWFQYAELLGLGRALRSKKIGVSIPKNPLVDSVSKPLPQCPLPPLSKLKLFTGNPNFYNPLSCSCVALFYPFLCDAI